VTYSRTDSLGSEQDPVRSFPKSAKVYGVDVGAQTRREGGTRDEGFDR
jgi:hypothetical protein